MPSSLASQCKSLYFSCYCSNYGRDGSLSQLTVTVTTKFLGKSRITTGMPYAYSLNSELDDASS
jgi:hypothetical protein